MCKNIDYATSFLLVSDPLRLYTFSALQFFSFYSCVLSTTLVTGMTGISLHMQWPLTSQLHGSFLKENNLFFVMNQTPRPLNHILCVSSLLETLQCGSLIS
jgi:hypothetical protein